MLFYFGFVVVETRPCYQNCSYYKVVRGDPVCPG